MNKRLELHSGDAVRALGARNIAFPLSARYGMAPGDWVGAVFHAPDEGDARTFAGFRWGVTLAPADEAGAAHRLFSARAESLASRAAWAQSFKFRRAVVPVDGIWMWSDVDGASRPFLIHDKGGAPLYLAALWQGADNRGAGELALVNVPANRLVEPFGARMPAILRGDDVNVWLERNIVSARPLERILRTAPARDLRVRATDPNATGAASLAPAEDARHAITWVYGPEFRPEKPRFPQKRRHVLRESEAGGHIFFRTKSFTRDDATMWHPVVDVECGHVFCDCPDFRYRHAVHEPDVSTPQWWCKHLRRAVANCKRHGELGSASV